MDKFIEYYENWKKQTQFIYEGHFENQWYKKIIEECSPIEIINHIVRILRKRNDYICYAFNDTMKKHFGIELVKPDDPLDKYIPLNDYCRKTLQAIKYIYEKKIIIKGLND